jgi:hypothetical protein
MTAPDPNIGIFDAFKVRGDVFVEGLVKVLHWAHAVKGVKLDASQLQLCLPYAAVGQIVQERQLPARKGTAVISVDIADIPDTVLAPLRAYLCETPDYDPSLPTQAQKSRIPEAEHGLVVQSLRKSLESYLL